MPLTYWSEQPVSGNRHAVQNDAIVVCQGGNAMSHNGALELIAEDHGQRVYLDEKLCKRVLVTQPLLRTQRSLTHVIVMISEVHADFRYVQNEAGFAIVHFFREKDDSVPADHLQIHFEDIGLYLAQ